MSQEIIHWDKLAPEERNMLIHTKVMGNIPAVSCPGTIINTGGTNSYYPDLYIWKCDTCGNEYLSHRDNFPLHPRLPHSQYFAEKPDIPKYSESMDAAWLIIQKVAARWEENAEYLDEIFYQFQHELLQDAGGEIWTSYELMARMAKWTPETVCIAALKAVGCTFAEDEEGGIRDAGSD